MDSTIFSELAHYLQNSNDGKAIVQQSNVSSADVHKVAAAVIPKITEQVKNSPQTLGDLFRILAQNKDDPKSMLNSKPGFDHQQAKSEGNEILKALFGSHEQTAKVADDVSQKTGVSVIDISSMLPMLAAMTTKLLGGKAEALSAGNNASPEEKENQLNEIFGFLDINKDGNISDDLSRMGKQVLANLFNKDSNKGSNKEV